MDSEEFKRNLKKVQGLLRNKNITVVFINGMDIKRYRYNTLKSFGNAILGFEQMGASFGFISVGNSLTIKAVITSKEFTTWLEKGVWNEVTFLATTVKSNYPQRKGFQEKRFNTPI